MASRPVARRAVPFAVLVVLIALLLPALAAAEGTHDLARPGTASSIPSASTTADVVPRGFAFRAEAAFAVESFGIEALLGLERTLTVEVRDLDSATPDAVIASGSLVAPASTGTALTWHDVPVAASFVQGRRYDVRFVASPNWAGARARYQSWNNAALYPELGFTVGPFLVLDGAGRHTLSGPYTYEFGALYHFRAVEGTLDAVPPQVVLSFADSDAVGERGWFNAASSGTDGVTLHVAATDDSGIFGVVCTDGDREVANSTSSSFDVAFGDGRYLVECRATDMFGNIGASVPLRFEVDQLPPVLAPHVEPNPVVEGGSASAFASARDALSGVLTESCDAVDTTQPGRYTVTCRAEDRAGNTAAAQVEYVVTFGFAGFFQPVANAPAVNDVAGGRAVNVKFSLGGDYGMAILDGGAPTVRTADCTTWEPTGAASPAAGSLQYDADSGRYTWRWRTDRAWTDCRILTVKLADGAAKQARFKFK